MEREAAKSSSSLTFSSNNIYISGTFSMNLAIGVLEQ